MSNEPMRIYVASLADYNAGRLLGTWIDLEGLDVDDVQSEITEMLSKSREMVAEEYAIHDYEGFGPLRISENENLEMLCQLANVEEWIREAMVTWCDNVGSIEYGLESFEDSYRGQFEDARDYAYETEYAMMEAELERVGMAPYMVYVDVDRMVTDMNCGGMVFLPLSDGGVAVFDPQ